MYCSRVKGERDVGIAHFQLVRAAFLRYHASADTYHNGRIGVLDVLVLSDYRKRFLLRVLTDCAGVDEYQLCVLRLVCGSISHHGAVAGKSFAVRFVLLATEGLDVIFLLPALPDELLHPLGKLQLRRDLVVYYLCFNIVLLHYISLLLYFKFLRDAGS